MKKSYKGPRRWAVLVLVIGVTSAWAFFRRPDETSRLLPLTSVVPTYDLAESPAHRGDSSVPELARVVSGSLPSTEFSAKHGQTALPDWVIPTSQLDELIQSGAPTPSSPSAEIKMEDLNTWIGHSLDMAPVSAPAVAPTAEGLVYRNSPWEGKDRSQDSQIGFPQSESHESNWPDQQLALQDVLRRANPSAAHSTAGPRSTVGNLIASPTSTTSPISAQATGAQATASQGTKTQATLSSQPPQRQFVYQPGFQGSASSERARN